MTNRSFGRQLSAISFKLLFSVICLLSSAAAVQAAPVAFDIPAQPAPAALDLFIKQSGAQVVYLQSDVKEVRTNAVKGDFEAAAALEMLLKDTGLSFSERKAGQFSVGRTPPKHGSIKGSLAGEGGRGLAGVLVAVRGTALSAETNRHGEYVFPKMAAGTYVLVANATGYQPLHITDVRVRAGSELLLGKEAMRKAQEGPLALEPLVVHADTVTELDPYSVEGRREKPFVNGNIDIPRTIDDVQPYYVFDAKTIELSGAADAEDFLKQRLTMNTIAIANGQTASAAGNTSTVNLRGLGTDKTLILVNGRRQPGVQLANSVTLEDRQPDINGIPLAAIERIEVLPSSASGIYGGSAIGGVVNIILKRNYSGFELRTVYNNTWDSDSPRRDISASYGLGLEDGKTQINLAASWSDQEPLLLQDRVDLFRRYVDRVQANSPTFITSASTPWLGSVPNVTASLTGNPTLTLRAGNIPLNSRITHVSAGTSPTTSTAARDAMFLANAGRWNLDYPPTIQAPTGLYRSLGSNPIKQSFQASIRREMTKWLELTAEASMAKNNSEMVRTTFTQVSMTPASPFNPFLENINVAVPDLSEWLLTTESKTKRASLGAVLKLPREWTGYLDYSWSANEFNNRIPYIDSTGIRDATANGTFNPFVDTLQYRPDLQRFFAYFTFLGKNETESFGARASGPLMELPWGGRPNLTVGLEHITTSRPEITYRNDVPVTTSQSFELTHFARDSVNQSAYVELGVPLVKTGKIPLLHALEAQLAGRFDHFDVDTGTPYRQVFFARNPVVTNLGRPNIGNTQVLVDRGSYDTNNFTYGLKYQPVKGLTLRASIATAFLPPQPLQLIPEPPTVATSAINDPRTNTPVPAGSFEVITGGNPDLKPQNSKSFNVGLVWEPTWPLLAGLRFNAEYYKIDQFDAIASLTTQAIVNQEATYPDRVVRDANGRITSVDITLVNLYRRTTAGWDLSLAYNKSTRAGRIGVQGAVSIIDELKDQFSLAVPAFDATGFHPGENGATKVKGNLNLTWEKGNWNAGWTARYFDSYKQYGVAGGPQSMQFNNGGVNTTVYTLAQGGDTVPSQTYHDAVVGYTFSGKRPGLAFLDRVVVQFGVRNVFNTEPPLDAFYSGSYYLSPYGDYRLREYRVSVKLNF